MLILKQLDVFGFQGGATYTVGENGVISINSLPSNSGYYVHYDNNETKYITGCFQFVATECTKDTQ